MQRVLLLESFDRAAGIWVPWAWKTAGNPILRRFAHRVDGSGPRLIERRRALYAKETLKKGPMAPFSNPPISVKNLGRETIARGFSEVT